MVPDARTWRNAAAGALVGLVLGYVPIVLLVAPLLGGGVAGALERNGWRRGATAGAIAGAAMAVVGAVVTSVVVFLRFGDLPGGPSGPLAAVAIATVLSLLAALGEIVVAAIGGALGALLVADVRAPSTRADRSGALGPIAAALVSLAVGVVLFVGVGLPLTVVLDPLIWPSLLVAIPVGIVVGAAGAVVVHHYLVRPPSERTGWRTVAAGALALVVVFALVVGGLWVLGNQRTDQTYESTYEYRVSVTANDTLEDVRFLVPVPATGDDSPIGERFVETVVADRYAPAIEGYDDPPAPVAFGYDLVDTDAGPMVEIRADRLPVDQYYYREVENETMGWRERIAPEDYDPTDPTMGVGTDGDVSFTITVVPDDRIETADPFGTEPLLSATTDRTAVQCLDGQSSQRCFQTTGRVFADYDADPATTVSLSVTHEGRNEWFDGGWKSNQYRQSAHVDLVGPTAGWVETAGDLEVGVGAYPDPARS